ncbi:hypothetical protein APHAL10511_004464 [Amanita phalloides]|nr:hypothetical protein APHAL10511_004464 [Amanita phalloides]
MARAEKLSEEVKALTLKVQQLEAALAQEKDDAITPQIQIPRHETSVNEVLKAIGSLSIGSDGQTRYHGESAGSEYFQELLPLSQESKHERKEGPLHLPPEITELMNSFPFGLKDCHYSKYIFVPHIPPCERALEIIDIYYTHVSWMYSPIDREDLMISTINHIYSAMTCGELETVHSHRLSVFFIILANGFLYDASPTALGCARQYQALARAAISFDSLTQEVTCATVQAFFLMLRFAYNSDRRTNEERWLLTGLTARLSQVIGLQRDSEGWNLDPEEVQRRRRLFWELFTWDSWTAIVNGRPPALSIQYADCRFPEDLDPSMKPNGESELGWHAWKFRYAMACLAATVQYIFSTRAPPYVALLELDKMIRRFAVPAHLHSGRESESWSLNPSRAMQQYCALCMQESNLLYIHRSYFAQAIRQDSQNPLTHLYAPSVLATYRSARRLISALRGVYALHPQVTGQVWFFWSGVYSACIVLGALVVESPRCSLARDAIRELDLALPFYEEGSKSCRAPNSLTILQKLRQRAATTYSTFLAGSEETKPLNPTLPSEPDELEVLGGRDTVIAHQTTSNPSSRSLGSSGYAEDDGSNNPGYNTGAAEMLVEYFEELGNHNLTSFLQLPNLNFEHSGLFSGLCAAYPKEQSVTQYAVGTGPGQDYHQDGIQSSAGQVSGHQPVWEEHNLRYHPAHVGRFENVDPMLYDPLYVGQDHAQTQEEIWRTFVSDYNGQ